MPTHPLFGRTLLAAAVVAACAGPALADAATPIETQMGEIKDLPKLIKNPTFQTLKLNDANVREVLRLIAKEGAMNLVIDKSVDQRITLDVRAMPLDELFALVLNMSGLSYRRYGTSILVASEAALKTNIDAVTTQTFRLENAKAEEMKTLLEAFAKQQGGGAGQGAAGAPGGQGGGQAQFIADARTNSIVVTASRADMAKIMSAVRSLDVPAPQVMIEVKLVEMSSSVARRLGGEFGFGGSKFGLSNNVTDPGITANGQPTAGNPSSGSGGSSITFSAMGNVTSNLNARINALIQNGTAKVLASPRVATQDSFPAEIKLVNKVPVLQVNFQGGQAGAALAAENIKFEEIGETLKITPRVDTSGFVTMDMEPTISVRGKDVIVNRNPVPEINERSLKTRMRVKSGEAVVIGGLIRRNTNTTVSKMPILGDLPVIGFMFKQETTDFIENEVVIMVTPTITAGEKLPSGF